MRKYILFLFLFSSITFGQMIPRGIFIELHTLRNTGQTELNICFKISYNSLVFKKENSKFTAQYTISAEIMDTTGKTHARESTTRNIIAESFESTNSPMNFSEGVLRVIITGKELNAVIKISDSNTESEFTYPPQRINTFNAGEVFAPPIVVFDNGDSSLKQFRMTNYGGRILFTSEKQILLFPVNDSSVSSLKIKILEKEDPEEDENEFVHEVTVSEYFTSEPQITQSDPSENGLNRLFLSYKNPGVTRYFVLRDFAHKLYDGFTVFEVSDASGSKHSGFPIPVFWYNKPLSAMNEDIVIQALGAVEDKNVIDELQSGGSDARKMKLRKYWGSIDPTPETKFNELQEEFFHRVDHAIRNFSTINKINGHLGDRGKIYIRYGTPTEIIRGVNKFGRITENWIYKEINREFIFTDRTGTNNFQLM
ncbi:MAG: GWxTD domain-containing protein [Ignavibacteriaceae bacterium]